jgi:L-lactate utilization protein LutC
VVSPGLLGCDNFGQLAQASSLCGACQEACPVDINLPELLLRVRAGTLSRNGKKGQGEGVAVLGLLKLGLAAFRLAASQPALFALGQRLGGFLSSVFSPRKKYMPLPGWTGWGTSKDFPRLEMHPFRSKWKNISQDIHESGAQPARWPDEPALINTPMPKSLTDRFADELVSIGARIYRLPDEQVPARLVEFLRQRGVERVFVDKAGEKYTAEIPFTRQADPSIRVGVTGAFAGIADTGSLILVGGESRSLSASLLPDIHIALLRAADIVPTLSDAIGRQEIRSAPAAVIITGPSRTADIEMTLSIGVHGPKELHVFLID